MATRKRQGPLTTPEPRAADPIEGASLPMIGGATSQFAEVERPVVEEPVVAPRRVPRGVVVFDLDGTILDDMGLISGVAAHIFQEAFGTPPAEGRLHYLATTGMPFEAQLAQLFPDAPGPERAAVARRFHERKIREAYALAKPFPEMPKVLKQLSRDGWTLAISTGAEREMADLLLEREGLRYWFEAVLGSGQGTKREHLVEYARRFPGAPIFLIGDSRFDMESVSSVPGARALGRASRLQEWTLTPGDLARWGAVWADYTLGDLPSVLPGLLVRAGRPSMRPKRASTPRRKR